MKKLFKSKSIKTDITFSFVLIILISNILLFVFNNQILRKYFSLQVNDSIEVITKQAADIIEEDIKSTESQVDALSKTWAFTKNLDKNQIADFYENSAKSMGFIEFAYIDTKGNGLNLNKEASKWDANQREYFKRSLNGEVYTSEILTDLVTNQKMIVISSPYYENGKIEGVFIGIKDANFISKLCKNFKWGESGILSVYDKNAKIVGHTRAEIVEKELNLVEEAKKDSSYKEVADFWQNEVLQKQSGVGEYFFTGNDKLAGFYNLDNRGYAVLVSINKSEVFAPLTALSKWLSLVALIIIIICALIVYFLIASSVANAFNNIKKDLEKIADYDLISNPSEDYSNRADEVGDIYRSSIMLKENLINIVNNIKASTELLENSSNLLQEKCDLANSIANDISNSIDDIARGATSQAEDTQTGVIQLQNMTDLLSKNKTNLQQLNYASDKTEILKNEGVDTMNELLESTQKNKDISKDIKEAMDKTKNSVDDIKSAGEMIKSIAEQTNLLALNAAIEAERAGEAGKGFAVVAEEIRKLAENSSSFTEQINNSVAELLSRADYAVDKINESSTVVEEQSMNVNEVEKKFDGIAESINSLRVSLKEIISSNEEIDKAQGSLYTIMENASALSEENAASTQEVAASTQTQMSSFEEISNESTQLKNLSEELKDIIDKFNI
ncbi:MAG: methyl-accepting chemotaxis protein [Peptoanaerobacter stomatis]|uniref:methyl-accepting chemotaxis protein n=1 Tax=Peptoanaerobacter stomatis TaxID=796937 RepID=UPI003FA106FD